jgi:hypothetical protein
VGAIDGEPAGPLLFEGELLVTEEGAVVGSSLTEELHPIPLPIGWHPVRIYADPPTEPARLTVVFDGQPPVLLDGQWIRRTRELGRRRWVAVARALPAEVAG